MPFKYVKGKDGKPVMPEVRRHHYHDPMIEYMLY